MGKDAKVYFDVKIGLFKAGRIEMQLFLEDCPITATNFMHLCIGDKGLGKTTGHPLHYKGSKVHRIIRGFMVQGGDFSQGNGTGGESIYGGKFRDENFRHRHGKAGLLSMANSGKDTNGSQFFITLAPAPHLDGKHVVFGAVSSGLDVLRKLEVLETGARNCPIDNVTITDCGLVDDGATLRPGHKKDDEDKKSSKKDKKKAEKKAEKEAEKEAKAEKKARKKEAKARQQEIDSRPSDWVDPSQLAVVTEKREADGRLVKGRGNLQYGESSRSRGGGADGGRSRSRERERVGRRRSRSRERDERRRSRSRERGGRRSRSREREREREREKGRERERRSRSRERERGERERRRSSSRERERGAAGEKSREREGRSRSRERDRRRSRSRERVRS